MGAKDRLRAAAVASLLVTGFPSAFAQNWTLTSAPETNWTSIACSADGNGLLAAAVGLSWIGGGWGGPIYFSTNSGGSWSSVLPTNLSAYPFLNMNWQSVVSSADGYLLAAAESDGGIYTWQTTPSPKLHIAPSGSGLLISWIVPSMPLCYRRPPI